MCSLKLTALLALLCQAAAFVQVAKPQTTLNQASSPVRTHMFSEYEEKSMLDFVTKKPSSWSNKVASSLAGFTVGSLSLVGAALAEEDLEIAELPPPYVPVLFSIALLGGVGVLTSSLGDVMTEESSLGMQSGARAKKEIERSRSSYFKKR